MGGGPLNLNAIVRATAIDYQPRDNVGVLQAPIASARIGGEGCIVTNINGVSPAQRGIGLGVLVLFNWRSRLVESQQSDAEQ